MLSQWLGDTKWDVIHFNFGLHDLKYMGKNGKNLADPSDPQSSAQVSLAQYADNLQTIATALKATGATVIWRETTPVPEGAKGRVPADAIRYNNAAANVIERIGGIQTDRMFAFATGKRNLQKPADVHYTADGSAELADHVADQIRKALAKR
jgi:acyl-CoA thioesterase-1